jgi:hypothetical protein
MQPISYARHQFPAEIIRHATWLYLRFTLSYRDVEELLAERGIVVTYESIRRFSVRPVTVKRFLAVLHHASTVPRALASLRNRRKWPFHYGVRRTKWNNLGRVLWQPCGVRDKRRMRTHLIHRPARDRFPLWRGSGCAPQHAVGDAGVGQVACASRVQRNSVPSVQMRCRTTARRRASAITALRPPRRRATFIAQAFSHDHLITRVSID